MNVHNLMEDIVTKTVNNTYNQVISEKSNWLSCDCENCRLDTVSYVLNRIPPKYVVSGRGVTHSSDVLNDYQLQADIQSLTLKGMHIVNTTKRPYHSENNIKKPQLSLNPAFNFSNITGAILDGTTFEPIIGAKVVLKCNGELAEMFDKSWSNPYVTVKSTNGIYNFWIKPIPAEKAGVVKKFNLSFEFTAEGYTPLTTHMELQLTSDENSNFEIDSTFSLKMKDIILFKEGIENEMED